jgi:hypothetical protein
MRHFYAPLSHCGATVDDGGVVMSVSRLRAVLVTVILVVPSLAFAQSAEQHDQQRCAASIPANVDPGLFAPDILALLRMSGTFRAQCDRIAADPRVRVRLAIVYNVADNGRAQTTLRRDRAGALVADVDVLFGENYRELLAHEFEHVIEQLDGVDLRHEAAEGRAWEIAGGVFETRRACLAGAQVVHEAATIPVRLQARVR